MKPRHVLCTIALALLLPALRAGEPVRRTWQIDGVEREALVSIPDNATTVAAPLVFVFHGHGGTMRLSSSRYEFHRRWPGAIVVCPQGLNTPGLLTDPKGERTGWQNQPGLMGDRDLHFFDAMLAGLRHDYRVDDKRIYVTGHSNGAGFTYLLWAVRGDTFAAVAPSAGAIGIAIRPLLKPKPAFLLAGVKDTLVKFEWQKASMDFVRRLDDCEPGVAESPLITRYPSKVGTPLVTYIHPGGHGFPRGDEPVEAILAFFQSQHLP